jgi:predicted TIM-barrel fold metal-dependent hydrolase
MVVSFHSMGDDEMDKMVKAHPGVTFVAAHPGEYPTFMRHLARMKMSDNYYLDLSGTGIFRHGMLRHAIDEFGAERFLFGSDYPICNPAVFVGGVLMDNLITDKEKELILSENAKRILKL